ncbi:hypothetical protein [Actinomadura sp. DC4]|uniref:hypothetical protein n=1 Tax=Actinomadura sp. DC4 TaxID=3055069 RepID=UPI0025B21F45|nr:hypothetical protein [Actinomadura sp. DC4]MDN3354755.1 hypothetical protein [Actinomadura sp. DC4]
MVTAYQTEESPWRRDRRPARRRSTGSGQAGGEAELHVWPGGFHSFDTEAPDAALSRRARSAQRDWIRSLLDRARGA